jgi:hypothetical protein
MTKISSAIMILRKATASAWTKDLDGQMNQWLFRYIDWLEKNKLALDEKAATKFVISVNLVTGFRLTLMFLLATTALFTSTKSLPSRSWWETIPELWTPCPNTLTASTRTRSMPTASNPWKRSGRGHSTIALTIWLP